MPAPVRVAAVTEDQLEQVLPLIAGYQAFYEVSDIDEGRNRAFFRRFVAPSEDGILLAAWLDGEPAGFACLYWFFTSTRAAESVLMNDLYVVEAARGAGIGRALIEAAAAIGRERGARHLEWATAPGNARARRLYDATGAEPSTWITYELPL